MQYILTPNAPKPGGHYSQAVVHDGLVYVAGQLPITPAGEKLATVTARLQAMQCLTNLKAIVEAAGSGMDKVLKCTVFIADLDYWPEVNTAFEESFGAHKPARSIVPVKTLHYGLKVEIEAVAAVI